MVVSTPDNTPASTLDNTLVIPNPIDTILNPMNTLRTKIAVNVMTATVSAIIVNAKTAHALTAQSDVDATNV